MAQGAELKDVESGIDVKPAPGDTVHHEKVHSVAIDRAKAATDKEHRMGLLEGIRTYPKAIGWSMLISLCIAMEAFDLCLLNTFYGLPQFQKKFGNLQSDGSYQIPAPWQAGLSNGRQAAEFVGLIINGWVSERFGYRYTVIVSLALIAAWTTIYYTADTLRLTSVNRDTDFDADETVAMIAHTTALEQQMTSGASYLDCFKGVDLRRTEIVCMVWAIQNLSGNSFAGYSTYFLEQAGLSSTYALDFTLGKQGINMAGVFGAWFLMSFGIGRRSLYLYGLCGLCIMLMVIGFLGIPEDRHAASLATGSMMLIWAAVYQLTVGTVCFSLVAEMSTRRLQIKTVALGRAAYNVVAIINNVLTPYMLNPTAWNWGNYAGFFWAGAAFLSIIYTYFRIPEPAGRTFAELDIMFERGISARKFKQTEVDAFEATAVEGGVLKEYEEKIHDVERARV